MQRHQKNNPQVMNKKPNLSNIFEYSNSLILTKNYILPNLIIQWCIAWRFHGFLSIVVIGRLPGIYDYRARRRQIHHLKK